MSQEERIMKMKNMLVGGAVALAVALVAGSAQAQTWNQTGAGPYSWNDDGNWATTPFPNAQGATANLNIDLLANQLINLNQAITIGTLNLGDTTLETTYKTTTIAANGGSLIMDVASGSATIAKATTGNNVTDTISANIALNSNLIVNNAATAATGEINLSGIISGTNRTLTKNGAGVLRLSNANTYSGGTFLSAGTLNLGNNTAIGTGTLTISGGTLRTDAARTLSNNNAIMITENFRSETNNSLNTGTGTFRISKAITWTVIGLGGGGTVTVPSVITDASGGNTLNAFDISYSGTSSVTSALRLSSGITLRGNQTWNVNYSQPNQSIRIDGVISDGGNGFGLTVAGNPTASRTATLNAANTYTGSTTVNGSSAVILSLGNVNALQYSALNANSAGRFRLASTNGAAYTFGGITGGTTALATLISTNYGYMNELVLNPQGTASNTYNGVIANGAANMKLTKTGTGTQVLGGVHTYSGATAVNEGTLTIAGSGSINSSSGITVAAGARLVYNSSAGLIVAPTLNGTGTGAGQRAVLGGTGTINAAVTLDHLGDVLSPGNSPGILPFGTSQTWDSFSYDWEVNDFTGETAGTHFDQITIAGSLVLDGVSNYIVNVLSLTAGNVAGDVPNFSEINRTWDILTTTTGITSFTAANWSVNATGFTNSETGTWSVSSDGSKISLAYVIPEPATFGIVLSVLAAAVIRRRRFG
jgi:autotransporter-associated beta strand protein